MRKSNQTKSRSLNAKETRHIIDCYAALLGSENAMFRDESLLGIGFLNHLFYGLSHIAGPMGCQSSFCLMKIPMLLRPARAAYERGGAADRVIK
jgi:hypothetical protein